MKHTMKLAPEPFRMIYNGEKTIELRLLDEKRREVAIGDEIKFINRDNPSFFVKVIVTALHPFASFDELYAALPLDKCGYTADNIASASPDDMLKYYPAEEQSKYSVVGIEFNPPRKPFRDLYRFDPFVQTLSANWQRLPDWRFGQLMINFGYWLERNGHGDGFYLEDDKYIELFTQFISSMFTSDDDSK